MRVKSSTDGLRYAIWEEDFNRVRELVENGADVNSIGNNGYTPLMQAAEMETIEVAQYLLEHGALVNHPGYEGTTPLHIAVDISIDGTIQGGGVPGDEPLEMINFLLENGANKNLKDAHGNTPIDWANDYKSKKVLRALQNEHS